MRKVVTLLTALLCVHMAFAQNKPLACQSDSKAGLSWENGQWKVSKFVDRKFILIMNGDTLTKESVSKAGLSIIPKQIDCKTDLWLVSCVSSGSYLAFNTQNFTGGITQIFGAVQGFDEKNKDTLSVEAFTCQPF